MQGSCKDPRNNERAERSEEEFDGTFASSIAALEYDVSPVLPTSSRALIGINKFIIHDVIRRGLAGFCREDIVVSPTGLQTLKPIQDIIRTETADDTEASSSASASRNTDNSTTNA
eukprot:scaffold652403_cov78-Prasinocladus_malaysianus.AAC.1